MCREMQNEIDRHRENTNIDLTRLNGIVDELSRKARYMERERDECMSINLSIDLLLHK